MNTLKKLGTVAVTYAPTQLVTTTGRPTAGHRKERLKWWADNCIALAKLMLEVPPNRHDQGDWTDTDAPPCETSACAMGWAALRHITPGLQYAVREDDDSFIYRPLVNGRETTYQDAADVFFGEDAMHDIFGLSHLTRMEVIRRLYDLALQYRHEAIGGFTTLRCNTGMKRSEP